MFFNSQNINDYVWLYPSFYSNGLQFPSTTTNNIQNLYGIKPIEQTENLSTDDLDERNEGSGGSYEESDETENENEDGDENEDENGDGNEDGDEDVGEETGTDFWQSLIDYFGICEGSNKAYRIAIVSRSSIKAN